MRAWLLAVWGEYESLLRRARGGLRVPEPRISSPRVFWERWGECRLGTRGYELPAGPGGEGATPEHFPPRAIKAFRTTVQLHLSWREVGECIPLAPLGLAALKPRRHTRSLPPARRVSQSGASPAAVARAAGRLRRPGPTVPCEGIHSPPSSYRRNVEEGEALGGSCELGVQSLN